MDGVINFQSKHGIVAVEVDEASADFNGESTLPEGMVPKGGRSDTAIPRSFDEAMGTFKTYAATLEELIGGLSLAPEKVTVEIGLKLKGSAGFVIARAGAESEMKVSMTWEPQKEGK